MENKPKYSPSRVLDLYLFNSSWGPKEGEEEKKIVYFWPEDCPLDSKLKKVGLVEGVTIFSSKFSASPAEALHTLKQRTVFLEVEPGFFLCIAVSVPSTRKQDKDGETIEFHPEDVSDPVLVSLVRRSHQMFRLFQGSLVSALTRCGEKKPLLVGLVRHFYSRYLAILRIEDADITAVWGGIKYLALEALDFLRVQSLINRMKEEYKSIRRCLFLHSGQLVWSGVEPSETKLLVQYLSTTILPLLSTLSRQPCGSFLVGEEGSLPLVYIADETFHLAVFHAINTTLCILLESAPPKSFFSSFIETIGRDLGNLSADLTHVYTSKTRGPAGAQESISFLYFNSANLALKSTVDEGQEKSIKVGADFVDDLRRFGGGDGQVMAKLWTEEWVVVEVAGARTIVLILQDKNLNLMEVAEAVAKLEKTSFDSICML